jgi:hypothetical protein
MNDLDKVVQEYVRNIVKDELNNEHHENDIEGRLNDFIENNLGELVSEYVGDWLDSNMSDYLEGRITVTID